MLNNQDRLIGVGATVGGIAITALFFILSNRKQTNSLENSKENKSREDEYHKTRYQQDGTTSTCTQHFGSCHCHQIRFKIRASRVLNAVDIPSKIRFPRVTIPCADFELMCDERALSMYTVKYGEGLLGIHSFCSFCGVQVLYSPTVEPFEIQVNVDCLDRHSIEKINVTYHSAGETDRLTLNHELSSIFNRRGIGAEQFAPPVNSSSYVHHHLFSPPSHNGSANKNSGGGGNNNYHSRESDSSQGGHYLGEFCSSTVLSDCGEDAPCSSSYGTQSRLSNMSEETYSDLYVEYGTGNSRNLDAASRRYSDVSSHSQQQTLDGPGNNTSPMFNYAPTEYYLQQPRHSSAATAGSSGSVSGRRGRGSADTASDGTDHSSCSSYQQQPLSLNVSRVSSTAVNSSIGGYDPQQGQTQGYVETPLSQHHKQLKKFMQPYLKGSA